MVAEEIIYSGIGYGAERSNIKVTVTKNRTFESVIITIKICMKVGTTVARGDNMEWD